ncbi:MAG: DUF421 domain-containing protein [Methylotenera sp.]|nr:MAG: DUF421 domain-containing protein [Methylotenera sp.]
MFEMSIPWWELILRAVAIYLFLIFLLRISGKRQIGELSPFDLVLLLIISNGVENAMNGGDDSLIGGLILATTLIVINYGVGVISYKNKRVEKLIEGRPQVLVHEGKIFEDVMAEAKLTRLELDTTLRQSGFFDLHEVKLAILETNGKVTVQGYEKKPKH